MEPKLLYTFLLIYICTEITKHIFFTYKEAPSYLLPES